MPANPTHLTIGSDITALLKTLKYPERMLGEARATQLRKLDPGSWYPIQFLLEMLEALDQKGGRASVVQMGRQLFRDSHAARVTPDFRSAGDVIFGMDAMFHHANRGTDIGGWEILKFGPGVAVMKKTTPHHCALEEGILYEALHSVGTDVLIVQQKCRRNGDPWCELELRSSVRDQRWMGNHPAI